MGLRRREKKKLWNLDIEAAKCRKLTEIFSSSTSQLNISSSEEVSQTAMQQHAPSDDDEGQKDELVPQADPGQVSMEHERRKRVTC